jgi:hypothetical protein
VAADAVKVAEAVLAGTVRVTGTANRDGRLLDSETTTGSGVDLLSVTVQEVLALEARLPAAHCRVDRVTGADNERVTVLDEPFSVATIVAA